MTDSQKWLVLACFAGFGVLLYLLAPVLTPFLLAALLAYLGDPLVDRLERRGLSRTTGVLVVFAAMLLAGLVALLVMVPLIERQVRVLIGVIPVAVEWLQGTVLPWIIEWSGATSLDLDVNALREVITEHWQQIGGTVKDLALGIGRSGQAVLAWFAYLLLVPVVTFYLLRDWDRLVKSVHDLLPRRWEAKAAQLARECDDVLGAFMRGQLSVMLALACVYTLGLFIVGLDLALLVGLLAGLVSFVPYLGFVVGILAAGIAALVQFQEWLPLVWVALVFGIGQALEGMVLSPWLVGDRIGLHPVAVIFAVMAGGQLFGFFGVLLALPVAAVIVVLLRHAHEFYVTSAMYTP